MKYHRLPLPCSKIRAALAALTILLAACGAANEQPAASVEAHPVVDASVQRVQQASFTETASGIGTVTARVGHVATLSAPAQSRITAVLVAPGDRVSKGTVLVKFDPIPADAAMASADAALSAAREAALRAHRLVDAGVSPRKDAEAADAQLAAANADAVAARRARQLAQLESPIAGVVTRINAVLGANADAGQLLVEVSDPAFVDIVVSVSPSLATHIRQGQSVVVHDGAAVGSVALGEARVERISAVVDSNSRAVDVRITLNNPSRTLRFGESLLCEITTATHLDAIVVPEEALVPDGEGFRVFVVDTAGVAHATAVTVGGRNDHQVWLRDGVNVGDVIVTKGAYGMDDGSRVAKGNP